MYINTVKIHRIKVAYKIVHGKNITQSKKPVITVQIAATNKITDNTSSVRLNEN